MDVVRFGVGHRRPDGPPGTTGVSGQVIHSDGRGVVSELAFARRAAIEPHTNPNTTWFIVIEGGGWVQVGEERTRVAAGEAVLWPAGLAHAAWTEHGEMRAFVVEFAGADDSAEAAATVLAGRAIAIGPAATTHERADGSLRNADRPAHYDPAEGEPS
jgi:quercetin dioxygenase-like cupin family protein